MPAPLDTQIVNWLESQTGWVEIEFQGEDEGYLIRFDGSIEPRREFAGATLRQAFLNAMHSIPRS